MKENAEYREGRIFNVQQMMTGRNTKDNYFKQCGIAIFFPWLLDIEHLAVMLEIGYSVLDIGYWVFGCYVGNWIFPALRDPALRDELLDIEHLAVMLEIGYSVLDIGY